MVLAMGTLVSSPLAWDRVAVENKGRIENNGKEAMRHPLASQLPEDTERESWDIVDNL